MKAFLVISRYTEDVEWIKPLTDNYIIINKGNILPPEFKQIISPNFGGNQYDIFKFIYDNYDNLPDLIAFLQGDPFDHCLPDRFYSLIVSESYTPIFGDRNNTHGNYSEINDNWYLHDNWPSKYPRPKFKSFDEYCNYIFRDYVHRPILTFPPGSQILVEKERCLFYSREFWKKLMDVPSHEVGLNGGIDAHIVERSIQIIFENIYNEHVS